jgi:hypothetical protein
MIPPNEHRQQATAVVANETLAAVSPATLGRLGDNWVWCNAGTTANTRRNTENGAIFRVTLENVTAFAADHSKSADKNQFSIGSGSVQSEPHERADGKTTKRPRVNPRTLLSVTE